MKTALLIVGVIFLVIGALLYFLPTQIFGANTTTSAGGSVDNRTSSVNVTVPVEWAYASAIIGLVLLIFGLVIPDPVIRSDAKKASYEKVVETKEDIEVGDGNKRKIVRERTETHTSKDDDSD